METQNENRHDTVEYTYIYKFGENNEKTFNVILDKDSLNLIDPPSGPHQEWTELNNCKCPNCPLDEKESPHCPVAVSIVDVIEFFRDSISYDTVDVTVEAAARSYSKECSLQQGVSPLLGLYMVTSGCPVLEKLKPMARYHLPFSTLEETSYRVMTMFLLAQYFTNKKGGKPDWELKKLVNIYEEIQVVNRSFWSRLSHIKIEDTSINALIILDTFASYVSFKIDEDKLSDIELLCKSYFD